MGTKPTASPRPARSLETELYKNINPKLPLLKNSLLGATHIIQELRWL